jgi:hypothetical protein
LLRRNEHRTKGATETEKNQMLTLKQVEGEVESNDGELPEIQTIGIEGIEKNLLLGTIQMHRSDDTNTPEEFRHRFPVGMRLCIWTVTVIEEKSASEALPVAPGLGAGRN